MLSTNFIYNFGQIVLDTSKKSKIPKKKGLEAENDEIIEEYEGECDECKEEKPAKSCPMCAD